VSLTTPRQHGQAVGSGQVALNMSQSGDQQAVTGYDEGSDVYAFSYSNYNGSGTIPRSHSKSHNDYDDADFTDGAIGGGNNQMHYEQYSRASSGYATMPRQQVSNTSGSSAHVQYSGNYNTSSSRSYSSTQNVMSSSSYSYGGGEVRSATSQPALPDLEKEMAGLEGLIKDLNGITSSGKIA